MQLRVAWERHLRSNPSLRGYRLAARLERIALPALVSFEDSRHFAKLPSKNVEAMAMGAAAIGRWRRQGGSSYYRLGPRRNRVRRVARPLLPGRSAA